LLGIFFFFTASRQAMEPTQPLKELLPMMNQTEH